MFAANLRTGGRIWVIAVPAVGMAPSPECTINEVGCLAGTQVLLADDVLKLLGPPGFDEDPPALFDVRVDGERVNECLNEILLVPQRWAGVNRSAPRLDQGALPIG